MYSCKDTDDFADGGDASVGLGQEISVGGVTADGLVASATVTRADDEAFDDESVTRVPGEEVPWLVGPLKTGLDITYGKTDDRSNTSRVAFLQLQTTDAGAVKYSDEHLAEYTFRYRNDITGAIEETAKWYGNGSHFFEGLYVPGEIKYWPDSLQTLSNVSGSSGTAPGLTTDQHGDGTTEGALGNYTLLSHYLAMPANTTINATVGRILLPFRHRLARVLAYILIDPDMGSGITIKGYDYTPATEGTPATEETEAIPATPAVPDDPTTTDIRFCNVDVLAGVEASTNGIHHIFTPQWTNARKAIPHFVGERGSYDDSKNTSYNDEHFIAFYNEKKKTYVYPTDAEWAELNKKTYDSDGKNGEYTKTVYGKVPVYDLIVRPTYTSSTRVMYDEEGVSNASTRQDLYVKTNQIDFELTLSNGLVYTKRFVFDLDANYQTVVYLHISRERVDYNSSGSDLWIETRADDDYYGVNNQNGNTLSFAGSSWQRAYTNVATTSTEHPNPFDDEVTDGHLYTGDGEDAYAQYVSDNRWIEMFRQAHEGGKHHGDYFILHKNITIPAAAFPDDFVFTGHLDGQDHTITITNSGDFTVTPQIVTFEAYTQNAEGTETKYVKEGENLYKEVVDNQADYYEEVKASYVKIDDIYAYSGAFAFVMEEDDEQTVTYTRVDFYKRVVKDGTPQTFPAKEGDNYSLFSGLNGNYSVPQETGGTDWQANVHQENGTWVPYKNATDGWRAEMINTNFNLTDATGCSVFSPSSAITGYLNNCWINGTFSGTPPKWSGTPIPGYTPSIPKY